MEAKPKHTPEPWVLQKWGISIEIISSEDNKSIAAVAIENIHDNAQRIIDCVNAFEGIENPIDFMNNLKKCLDIEATPELIEKTVREQAESLS